MRVQKYHSLLSCCFILICSWVHPPILHALAFLHPLTTADTTNLRSNSLRQGMLPSSSTSGTGFSSSVKSIGIGRVLANHENTYYQTPTTTTTTTRLFMSTKAAQTAQTGRKRVATCMAFLTGWADIAFITKFQSFATMLTGNTMWMALAASERRYTDVMYYTSVIASYLLGTALFRRIDLSLRQKTLPVCSLLVAGLFVAGDVIHFCTSPATSSNSIVLVQKWIPMSLFATAYGITNALGTEVSGTLTFVVTGHLTRLVNQLVDRCSRTAGRIPLTAIQKAAVVQNFGILGGFVAGAVFAGVLQSRQLLNKFGIFSVIGISHALLWLAHDMEALGGAWWLRKDQELCDYVDDDGGFCDMDTNESDDQKQAATATTTTVGNTTQTGTIDDPNALKP